VQLGEESALQEVFNVLSLILFDELAQFGLDQRICALVESQYDRFLLADNFGMCPTVERIQHDHVVLLLHDCPPARPVLHLTQVDDPHEFRKLVVVVHYRSHRVVSRLQIIEEDVADGRG
jgi:hypothetical protein